MSNLILKGSYNALAWGPGTGFYCDGLRGFDDLPQIISRDQPRAVADGTFAGQDLLGEHSVFVTLVLDRTSDADLRAAVDAVNTAFSRQTTPKALRWWNLERYVWARPRERTWSDINMKWVQGLAVCTTRFVLADPNVYIGVPP